MKYQDDKNGIFSRKWYLFGFIPVWKETRIVNYLREEVSAADLKKEILEEINKSLESVINPNPGR